MTNPTPHGQVPEALRLAHIFDNPLPPEWPDMAAAAAELRRQHARIAELEAELEAVGAGGVQALSAAPAVPAGWKLVPVEPSVDQEWKGKEVSLRVDSMAEARKIYRAMLAASPTPPAEQQATKETSGGFNVWRDISTAPKDGSRFVAIGYNYGLYSEGRHICVAQWFRGCWMETSDWNETSELKYLTHWMPLPSPPDDVAAPAEQPATTEAVTPKAGATTGAALGVGNSGFDHQTAADFLSGKTVSDEAVRKFVQASRWAHDEKASLGAMLLSVRGELASRNAEIALLKSALMEAEAAPQQEAQEPALFVSAKQLADFVDPSHATGGSYLPARKTRAGLFTQPLYKTPQPAPAPLSDDTERLREALQRIEGASMSMYATRSDMLEHCQDIARAAIAAQGGKA